MFSAIESLASGSPWEASSSLASRYQPLVVVALALAAGIVGGHAGWLGSGTHGFVTAWLATLIGLGAWWWFWRGGQPVLSAWVLVGAIVASGGAWHELQWSLFDANDVGRYAALESAPACVDATLLTAPEVLPPPRPTPFRAIPAGERCRSLVQVRRIRDGTDWLAASGRCQLIVDSDLLAAAPGDDVRIFAQLRRPQPPLNPGEFDFAALARADRRLASLTARSPDCVAILAPSWFSSPSEVLAALRDYGQRTLRTYVGPRQAGIAAAVLLGVREELPREETMPFFLTGTVHLLVVSGLNVAILATGLYALVWIGWLPRRVALALTIAVVAIYALVAGAEPPVLRAALLVVIVCAGAWIGRRGVAFNSLAAAAVIVLAINPLQLFQAGTQLSFLCVAILIWIGNSRWFGARHELDPLERLIDSARPWYVKVGRAAVRWFVLLMLTSLAIWVATLPLVLYQFHVASPVALLITPVVWLLALVAMWAGFITLACGWLVPIVAVGAGAVCSGSFAALVRVVEWAEAVPGGHFWAPGPALWWVVGFYLGLVAVMLWQGRRIPVRWQWGLAAAWIVVGLVPPLVRPLTRGDNLQCTFLAMGHGTCVVLEMPDGVTLLYDAGSLGPPEYAMQSVAGYLWHRGITRIDGIVLSHADVDHYNAVPGLLERFRVGAVYVSPLMFDWRGATGPSEAPQALRYTLDAAGVPVREVWAGDRLRVGGVTLTVLHPPRDGVLGSDNANSITLAVEYARRRLLLPGDLETPGLEDVIAELPVDCDVLMAPHHGSRRSDPPGFAAWSTPEWVVVSGGAAADPGVLRTYRSTGAEVLNTGDVGAVTITLGSTAVDATAWREHR